MILKKAFFSKKYEKSPSGWGLRPQTPVCDTFKLQYTSLLKHVSRFIRFHIELLVKALFFEVVPSYVPAPGHGF